MRFEDLYLYWCNVDMNSIINVLEEGKMPVKSKLEDIYEEIYDRQVIWFSVENGDTILIKLKEE